MTAHANLNCKVTEVIDSSFLEESLSVEEYPNIQATEEEVTLGSSVYSVNDGSVIEFGPAVGFEKNVTVIDPSGEIEFLITANDTPSDRSGKLWGKNAVDEERSLIAELICQ